MFDCKLLQLPIFSHYFLSVSSLSFHFCAVQYMIVFVFFYATSNLFDVDLEFEIRNTVNNGFVKLRTKTPGFSCYARF